MRRTPYVTAGIVLAATFVAGCASVTPSSPAAAAPAPVVTSVTPAADTTDSQVVVSGSNLTLPPNLKPDKIMFGSVKATVNSCAPLTGAASSCNVTVPPQCLGHKVVDVRVIVGTLESAISKGDQFTYTDSGKAGPCPSSSGSPTSTSSGTATSSPTGTPTGKSTSTSSPSTRPTAPASKSPTAIPTVTGLG